VKHLPVLLEAAQGVQDIFVRKNWRFCFIGGIAVQRWGEPRLTLDVDLTLLTGFGEEESYVERVQFVSRSLFNQRGAKSPPGQSLASRSNRSDPQGAPGSVARATRARIVASGPRCSHFNGQAVA
jgi:hypothetical protein